MKMTGVQFTEKMMAQGLSRTEIAKELKVHGYKRHTITNYIYIAKKKNPKWNDVGAIPRKAARRGRGINNLTVDQTVTQAQQVASTNPYGNTATGKAEVVMDIVTSNISDLTKKHLIDLVIGQ